MPVDTYGGGIWNGLVTLTDQQIQVAWNVIAEEAERWINRTQYQNGLAIDPNSELAVDDGRADGFLVSSAVRTGVTSAVDHLHALCALIFKTGVLHRTAPYSMARGAIESACQAIWITESDSSDDRLARALRWYHQDATDSDAAARDANAQRPTPLPRRHSKIEAVANKNKLRYKPIKAALRSTELVQVANGRVNGVNVLAAWRFTSGYAHGRFWPNLADIARLDKLPTGDPDMVTLKMTNQYGGLMMWAGMDAYFATKTAIELFDLRAAAR